MADDHEDEDDKLVMTSVYLEGEVLKALEEAARELARDTVRRWSKGGIIRPAVSDFFMRRGQML